MASKNVVLVSGVIAVLGLVGAGCGNPPSMRPDGGTDTGTVGTDTGMGDPIDAFRPPNDTGGARVCRSPMGTCDLLAQDCPMGETCVYALPDEMATTAQTVCAPIVGAGAEEGGPCCAINSCDRGLVCVGSVQTAPGMCTSMGTCHRYCCGSAADCTTAGETCNGLTSGFMGGVCDSADGCDLVRQTGCEMMAGTSCYPSMGGTQCVPPTAAMVAEHGTCGATNDCVPGTACFTVTPGGGGPERSICLRFCDVGDGAMDCPNSMGVACQANGGLPAGTGICPPPPA